MCASECRGPHPEALEKYTECIRLNPNDAKARYGAYPNDATSPSHSCVKPSYTPAWNHSLCVSLCVHSKEGDTSACTRRLEAMACPPFVHSTITD